MSEQQLPLNDLRERLESEGGPDYWRSLEEAADTEEFQEALDREFPEGASEWPNDPQGRRHFLKLMGASAALAGLSGCALNEDERIVPYVEQPESVVPGEPDFYATSFRLGGYAMGVLAESHEGRPTKIEGNPAHPASLGATSNLMQASILNLYDPDHSETTLHQGTAATWEDFVAAVLTARQRWRRTGGAGLRILTGTVTSPTLAAQLRALLSEFPQAQWHYHDPVASGGERNGLRQALGREAQPIYHFDEAEVVFSLEGDYFMYGPASVRYAHDFAETRRVHLDDPIPGKETAHVTEGEVEMSRLYAVESSPTLMGAMADHRLPLPPTRLKRFAQAAARQLGALEGGNTRAEWSGREQEWLEAVVSDLQSAGEQALVVAGRSQPPDVHALAARMNRALGAVGTTVEYIPPVEAQPTGEEASLRALTEDMAAGAVDSLVILGENPAYAEPADLPFADLLPEVPFSVHLSRYVNETSTRCQWHVPRTHYLESWGDARAFDGTASIVQPLIRPLYDACRSRHEVVAALQGAPGQAGYDLVRRYWRRRTGGGAGGFRRFWEQALYRGVVPGTGHLAGLPRFDDPSEEAVPGLVEAEQPVAGEDEPPVAADTTAAGAATDGATGATGQPLLRLGQERQEQPADTTMDAGADTAGADTAGADTAGADTAGADTAGADTTGADITAAAPSPPPHETLELLFRPDPSVWDGRFANNPWLQELPKPLTKITWDNAALMSAATAERLGVEVERVSNEPQDVLELQYRGRSLRAPAWVVPGHADGCVTLRLGYGRESAGFVGGEEDEASFFGIHEEDEMGMIREGESVGVSAYRLRTADAPWGGPGLTAENTGETFPVASTQAHWSMEGRHLLRPAGIEEFRKNPDYPTEGEPEELISLFPEYEYDAGQEGPYAEEDAPPFYPEREYNEYDHNYKWGMVIDQNVCTGCNACVTACQSENNIPVVGKEQVRLGREMHWLRIDRYFEGSLSDPETYFQPVPCMHCEKAPCEVVCPVAATVHDAEGLNVMVYNRCIGTRYCSNNCPYKVRRFNFLQWNDWDTNSLKLMRNPDVTVRSRGVMEKCTYCIQRISAARIEAKTEDRQIRDGEMLTACQQACPTQAITFGDLNDETAEVHHLHEQPHNYGLLEHLGTRPRTTYLTHLSNEKQTLSKDEPEDQIRQRALDPEVKTHE